MPWSLLLVMHAHLLCRVKLFLTAYHDCLCSKRGGEQQRHWETWQHIQFPLCTAASGYPYMLVCSCKYLTLGYILTSEYFDTPVNLVAWFYIMWLYKWCSALCIRDWSNEVFFWLFWVFIFWLAKVVDALSLEACKARLDGATWSNWRYPCSWQGSWNQTSLGSLPTPNHSMILWFWCNPPAARYSVDFCKQRGKEAKCHMGESFKGDCTTAECSEE